MKELIEVFLWLYLKRIQIVFPSLVPMLFYDECSKAI